MNTFLPRLCLAAGLPLGVPAAALALDPARAVTQYIHEAWTPREGAPSGTINGIAQTPDGFLWLATESEGLVRFDGKEFTRVAEVDRLFGPRTTSIASILVRTDGELLVAGSAGLARLANGKWSLAFPDQAGGTSETRALHEARDGSVWFARPFDREFRLGHLEGGRLERLAPRFGFCRAAAVDGAGEVWVGTFDAVFSLRGGKGYTAHDGLGDRVEAMYRDRAGAVWIGTRRGLGVLRGGSLERVVTRAEGLPSEDVKAILEDRDGNLWLGTSAGLVRKRGGRFETFSTIQGLSDRTVRSIFEDREGSLWVGTAAGLNRLRDGAFTTWGEHEGLAGNTATTIASAAEGTVWVWSDGAGLSELRKGRVRTYTEANGLSSRFGGPILVSRDGSVWIGHGTDRGLSRLKDGRATVFSGGELNKYIPALAEDEQGLLLGILDVGLRRFVHGRLQPYRLSDGSVFAARGMIRSLRTTSDGTLWVAGDELVAIRDGRVRRYGSGRGPFLSLSNEGADGALWVATEHGLARVKAGRLEQLSGVHGPATDRVLAVLEDRHAHLWFATPRAIVRASLADLDELFAGRQQSISFRSFGSVDGMRSAESLAPAQPAACAAHDGRLWFATTRGAVVVDPANLRTNAVPPPVLVEKVLADGKPLADPARPVFPAGSERFEIHYNGLSLFAPERMRFLYRLEGYDADWIEGGPSRVAHYMNLAPATYTFRVKAANNDGVWSEREAVSSFTLEPRFHQTLWSRLLGAFVLVAAVAGLFRVRVAQLRARERRLAQKVDERTEDLRREIAEHKRTEARLEAERDLRLAAIEREMLAEERARIARELHDSLAQNFAGLSLQLQSVAADLPAGADAPRASLELARRMLRHGQNEARRAVWDLRSPAGESEPLRTSIEAVVARLAHPGGPAIEVRVEPPDATLRPIQRRHVLRIVEEALANAVTHAEARSIEVACSVSGQTLEIEVRDDGRGFRPDCGAVPAKGHFGLLGMRERASKLGGRLEVESRLDGGTRVHLCLARDPA